MPVEKSPPLTRAIAGTDSGTEEVPRPVEGEGSERDFRAVLIRDGTYAVYDAGLHELKSIGVSVMIIDQCIAWLNHLKVERTAR